MRIHFRHLIVVAASSLAVGLAVSKFIDKGWVIAVACFAWGVFLGICDVNILYSDD